MIPQKLEKVLQSDFSFLTFGTNHPESLLYAEFIQEGYSSPIFVFGPEDDKSELSFSLRPRKDTEFKVGELHSSHGVTEFCFSPKEGDNELDHYRMHMRKETLPSCLNYESVSWDELMNRMH